MQETPEEQGNQQASYYRKTLQNMRSLYRQSLEEDRGKTYKVPLEDMNIIFESTYTPTQEVRTRYDEKKRQINSFFEE